jgi:hypothetical protein
MPHAANMMSHRTIAIGLCCLPLLFSCDAGVQEQEELDLPASTALTVTYPSITLVAGDHYRGGYDFSLAKYTDLTPGDFYFVAGAFWANNTGQRGVVKVGACTSVDSVRTIPTSGYSRYGVKAVVGNCFVSLTHDDERDNIVFRVSALSSTNVTLTWKLVKSGKSGATLIAGDYSKGGYDFSARTYMGLSGGDFYFVQGGFWANNAGQRGLVNLGSCTSVDNVSAVPTSGYWTQGVTATAGNCYVSQTHFEEHNYIVFRVEELTSTTATLTWKVVDACYGLSSPSQNVDCWLSKNSKVAQALAWENRVALGQTSVTTWPQWTNVQRDDLRASFLFASSLLADPNTWDPDPLVDPPTNLENLQDNTFPATVLSANDAWRLYIKTVAMSLAVELRKYVAWSVVAYDSASLASLFDGRHMVSYTWSGAPGNLGITVPQAEGYILVSNNYDSATHATFSPGPSFVVPAPPKRVLKLIQDKGLLGSTRLQTITNAIGWARRLHHFVGEMSTAVFQRVWQYRGAAPVSRTMDATVDPLSSSDAYRYTAGCHGTSGFLNSVLRVLNIPVDSNSVAGHSLTRFMTEGLYLSHGDDLYIHNDPYGVPPAAMLISDATFRSWFVTPPSALVYENIGRNTTEQMIKYLSGRLEMLYCMDPVPNQDHAHSLIMTSNYITMYPSTYTLNYLEHLPADPANPGLPSSLWDRLAQKIAGAGGCSAVVQALNDQFFAFAAVRPVSEQLSDYYF